MGFARRHADVILATLAVGALTAARLAGLFHGGLNLHGDEAQYWSWARELDFGYFSKPPMIAWVIAATTAACGDGEACVRLSSPLLHGMTALVLFQVAAALYDTRAGLWAAVLYATLPGVSFSSLLVSTDVPLLFFWSVGLLALVRLRGGGGRGWAALLGAAVGLGMLSKYAMAYFVAMAVLAMLADRGTRHALLGWNGLVALPLAGLLFAPNVLWNLRNGWATVGHTADNANWEGLVLHPARMGEFALAQFGLMGPLLFAAFAAAALTAFRRGERGSDRLLACLSVPVLIGVTLQALASRAHANWAATAYPAAVVLAAAALPRGRWGWVRGASLALHGAAAALLILIAAEVMAVPATLAARDPLARLRGWDTLAALARDRLAGGGYSAVMADDRMVVASLKYYLRDAGPPILVWGRAGTPLNHFEMTAALTPEAGRRVLHVSLAGRPPGIHDRFAAARQDAVVDIPTGRGTVRRAWFHTLDGFAGY